MTWDTKVVRFLMRIAFNIVFLWYYKLKVEGAHHVPKEGGAIIAPNHNSNFDPPIVGSAIKRIPHFMAKEELFRNPFRSWIISRIGAFPVHRGKIDVDAIRKAYTLLKDGELLGIFPEGTRSNDGNLKRFHDGMAVIALRTGMPIIPTVIIGSRKMSRKNPPRIVFCEPIYIKKQKVTPEMIQEVNKIVYNRIHDVQKYAKGENDGN